MEKKRTINRENIKKLKVESSNLDYIGYNDGALLVGFKNGGEYLYMDVEKEHYDTMISGSTSVGKYFMTNIRDKYTCIKF